MRVFVLVVLLVVVVGIAGFVSLNYGKAVDSVSLGFTVLRDVPLGSLVGWAFGAGFFCALVVCIVQEIRLRLRISQLKASIKRLQSELDELRTMPLSEMDLEDKEGR